MTTLKRNWVLGIAVIAATGWSFLLELRGKTGPTALFGTTQAKEAAPSVRFDDDFLLDNDRRQVFRQQQPDESPYEQCMRQLDPTFDPKTEIYLHAPKSRSFSLSLTEAMANNSTTIYFLHQRKAGGSTIRTMLYRMAVNTFGKNEALKLAHIPCHAPKPCARFEMGLYENNYLGSVKVVGAHMSYHTPFARAAFEDQVLITNFREPLSRIKSCMLYRYIGKVKEIFGHENYTHADGEHLLLTQKDSYRSSCVQEPLRILSPLDPDKEPLSRKNMYKICCLARSYFHVIQTPPPASLDNTTTTLIEREIMEWMDNHKENVNQKPIPPLVVRNLNSFMEHIRLHPMVQAETDLYNCVINTSQDRL